jgi:carboxylesterase
MNKNTHLVKPHLPGKSFFWEAGPTGILLIHGLKATTAEVRPLAHTLHDHGYTVAGPLLPGHGTSPKDANQHSWREWLDRVTKDYQSLTSRCERVFVGGESTGGLLALHLASEYTDIAGALVYAPALKLMLNRIDRIKLSLLAPFVTAVPSESGDRDLAWQGYNVNPLRATQQLLRLQRQVRRRLLAIDCPVLIVQGRADHLVDPRVPEIIADEVSSDVTEIHWMEDSGHCVVLDYEQDQVAKVTLDFIERCSAT